MHGYFLGQQSLIICFVIDFKFQWSSKVSTSMFEFREHNTMCFLERRHSQSLGMEFSQMSSEPDIEAYCISAYICNNMDVRGQRCNGFKIKAH